jgi:thioesterase domain-containing protein
VLKMLAAFKAQSGRSIAMAWVFQAPTPAQLAALVDQQRTDRAWKHLVVLNQGANRNPLFCLNGFDGDVNDYLHIARFVDPTLPVYGLEVSAQAQDEGFRDVLDRRMEVYEQEIRSIQPQGPYRLCGFSFGGSEAFHLARRLEDAGEQVLLILIDAFRPSKSLVMLSWGPRMLAMLRARTVFLTARRKLRNLVTYELHRWLTGKDKDLRHALFRHAMTRVYKPFSGKTVLIKSNGIEDWAFQLRLDEFNGWKKYIKGSFDVIHIDAGHVGLIKEPAVKTLASHLDAILRD